MKTKNKNHLKRAHASLYIVGDSYKRWQGRYAKPSGRGRIAVLIYSGTPKEIAQKTVNYEAYLIGNYYGNPRDFYVYITETKTWYRISRYLNVNPCEKPW